MTGWLTGVLLTGTDVPPALAGPVEPLLVSLLPGLYAGVVGALGPAVLPESVVPPLEGTLPLDPPAAAPLP